MRKRITALLLGMLLLMPCMMCAEEIEIQLMEVIGMQPIPGEDPLDDPEQTPPNPTRPRSFRATINGSTLSIFKQDETIPSAQATVVNASTGGIVVNQQFSTSLSEQISNTGVYVLHIQTAGGALVGQFMVQ